ncbi:hypothetical protein JQX13_36655 [Archangium violaceum]|nr:hypothetical protein JQX13_36655 [Archangium violaceum]
MACDLMPHSGSPLSSQPTLCRLENAVDGRSVRKLLGVLEQHYLDSFTSPPEVVVLDAGRARRCSLRSPGPSGRRAGAPAPDASAPPAPGRVRQECRRPASA